MSNRKILIAADSGRRESKYLSVYEKTEKKNINVISNFWLREIKRRKQPHGVDENSVCSSYFYTIYRILNNRWKRGDNVITIDKIGVIWDRYRCVFNTYTIDARTNIIDIIYCNVFFTTSISRETDFVEICYRCVWHALF